MPNIEIYDEKDERLSHLTQWDLNRVIKLKNYPYDIKPLFHFAIKGDSEALAVEATLDNESKEVTVSVPNILLQRCKNLLVYIYLYNSSTELGTNIYKGEIPILYKPKPTDYIYTENADYITLIGLKQELQASIDEANEIKIEFEQIKDSLPETIDISVMSNVNELMEFAQKIETAPETVPDTLIVPLGDVAQELGVKEGEDLVFIFNAIDTVGDILMYVPGKIDNISDIPPIPTLEEYISSFAQIKRKYWRPIASQAYFSRNLAREFEDGTSFTSVVIPNIRFIISIDIPEGYDGSTKTSPLEALKVTNIGDYGPYAQHTQSFTIKIPQSQLRPLTTLTAIMEVSEGQGFYDCKTTILDTNLGELVGESYTRSDKGLSHPPGIKGFRSNLGDQDNSPTKVIDGCTITLIAMEGKG